MLAISCSWLPSIHESPEVRETSARLTIALGSTVLTRNVDDWSRTVQDDIRLSAYPMALWLASNWWRLRWEPMPSTSTAPTLSWRMAHELAAAGHGYVWPRVLIASDGEIVQIWATPSGAADPSPVNFLTSAHGALPASAFELAIDRFLAEVVARLDDVGLTGTTLQSLVAELGEERADPSLAAYRRLEAMAGFDAGEGDSDVMAELEALVPRAGFDAAQELASLFAPDRSRQLLVEAVRLADEFGVLAQPMSFDVSPAETALDECAPAWRRGKGLAIEIRQKLALSGQPILDSDLLDIMGVASAALATRTDRRHAPFGLAVRGVGGRLALHPRRSSSTGFRFELARYLCDHVMASDSDNWLPVTDGKTSRQKAQRAFAAEFLCPVEALQEFLNGDLTEDSIEDAARHFGVGPLAVQSQLVNNGVLKRAVSSGLQDEAPVP